MLANPAIIYALVWGTSLWLYSLHYSNLFLELSRPTLTYIGAGIFSVVFAWLFIGTVYGKIVFNFPRHIRLFTSDEKSKIAFLFRILIAGMVIELLYFRDVPVLSLFGWSTMTYHQFGLPSLHGFLSAILLSLSMYALYYFLATRERTYLYYFAAAIIVLLMSMNRGGITSLLIQSFFVVTVFWTLKKRTFFRLALAAVVFVYFFGLLGELRNHGAGQSIYDVFAISAAYPDWLPKNFIWVYMYLTSSLNNLENSLSAYPDFNFEPHLAMFGLLPTIIRIHFTPPEGVSLVNEAFNVSSFMPNYLAAFGVYGSVFFFFFAALVTMWIFYRYVRTYDLRFGFTLVILLHSIALSIFSDFFAIQVYLFQVILQFWIFNPFTTKKNLDDRLIDVQ